MIAEDFLSRLGFLLCVLRSCHLRALCARCAAHWLAKQWSRAGLHQTWQSSDWLSGGRRRVYTKHGFPVYWRASRNGRKIPVYHLISPRVVFAWSFIARQAPRLFNDVRSQWMRCGCVRLMDVKASSWTWGLHQQQDCLVLFFHGLPHHTWQQTLHRLFDVCHLLIRVFYKGYHPIFWN